MLGDFINRCLVVLLGYAYPAFECYKTVERNKVDIEELRFWCQYWIIVAFFTVLERFGDIFMSWLPMYGETKVALFIYLWYPKTKGTGFVYNTLLRPYISKHEPEIDRKLLELKARAWDLASFHLQNFRESGISAFLMVFEYLVAQSAKFRKTGTERSEQQNVPSETPTTPANGSSIFRGQVDKQVNLSKKSMKVSSSPPESPTVNTEEASMPDSATKQDDHLNDSLSHARMKLRRLKSQPQTPKH